MTARWPGFSFFVQGFGRAWKRFTNTPTLLLSKLRDILPTALGDMVRQIFLWGLGPLAAFVVLMLEVPMALGKTVTLFSEINATLVDGDGTPQPGIRIERWWRQSSEGDGETDTVTTDDSGAFHFPAVTYDSTWAGILPGTPAIKQRITAFGPEGEVRLWFGVKTSFDANSETGGRPARLICRIDQAPNADGPVFGTCRFAD